MTDERDIVERLEAAAVPNRNARMELSMDPVDPDLMREAAALIREYHKLDEAVAVLGVVRDDAPGWVYECFAAAAARHAARTKPLPFTGDAFK